MKLLINKIQYKTVLISLFLFTNIVSFDVRSQESNPVSSYIVNGKPVSNWVMSIGNGLNWYIPVKDQHAQTTRHNLEVSPGVKNTEGDAIHLKWEGKKVKNEWGGNILYDTSFTLSKYQIDLSSVKDRVALTFDFKLNKRPTEEVSLNMQCNNSNKCVQKFRIKPVMKKIKTGKWLTLPIPFSCFKSDEPFDYSKITSILSISTQGQLDIEIANIGLTLLPEGSEGCH